MSNESVVTQWDKGIKCAVVNCSNKADCLWQPTRDYMSCFLPGNEHQEHPAIPLCNTCRQRILTVIMDRKEG